MFNKIRAAGLAGALLATTAIAVPAMAEEETSVIPGEFSANVAISTNYLYRGVSQTSDGPAVSGGFDYSYNIFYAGVWASSLDFGDTSSTGIEIDYYAGIAPEFNGITWDTGLLYYTYPDSSDDGAEQDFLEIYTGISGTVAEVLDLGLTVSYSDDFYLESGQAFYYDFSAGFAIGYFGIDGHYGVSDFDEGGDYDDWNIGISTEFEGFGLDLRYYDTDISTTDPGLEAITDEAFVFTVSRAF